MTFDNIKDLIKNFLQGEEESGDYPEKQAPIETNYRVLLAKPLSDKWKKIGINRKAGIRVPLFFIYSHQSAGIGEIPDLKLLIDWCVTTGNSILELLPLNDMGFVFSPYSAESAFALDPVYLSLRKLKAVKGNLDEEIYSLQTRFPSHTNRVNYGIKGAKLKILWDVFSQIAEFPPQFHDFVKENSYWLKDYSCFRALKDIHQQKKWEKWKKPLKEKDPALVEEFKREHQESLKFHQWLQWQLYEQMKSVKQYAESRGVWLKGDFPWMVSRDSADVWSYQEKYFDMNSVAGAPPDVFSVKGQRWGMPPLKWDNIFADDFAYISQKLKFAENFYHMFRIDHIVGLFRIWKISRSTPKEKKGLEGRFVPEEPEQWKKQGKKILQEMIKNTSMLPCGEDLGSIPPCCPQTMEDLGIPGIRVQRWTHEYIGSPEFKKPQNYSRLSTATLSTHDTSNWLDWWKNEAHPKDKKRLMKIILKKEPLFLSLDRLMQENLEAIHRTRSVFCVLLLTEWLVWKEYFPGKISDFRFNYPGTTSEDNWTLRMPFSLEELFQKHSFNKQIKEIIIKTKREPPTPK